MAERRPALVLGSNGSAPVSRPVVSSSIFRGLKFFVQWTPDEHMFNHIHGLIVTNGGGILHEPSNPLVTHLIVHPAEENRSTKDLVVSVPPPRAQDVAVFNARRLWKADDLVGHFARRSAGYPQTTNITKIANYQFGADARYQYKYNKVVIRKEWVEEAIEAGTKFHGGDGYAGWEVKCTIIAPTPDSANVPPPPPTLPPPLPPTSTPLPPGPSSSTPTPTQSLANKLSMDVFEKPVTPTPVTAAGPTPHFTDTGGRPSAATSTSASPRLVERLGPPPPGASKTRIYKPFPFTRSNTCSTASAPSPQHPPPAPFALARSNTFTANGPSRSPHIPASQVITDDTPSLDFEWKFASQEHVSPRQNGESSRAQSETRVLDRSALRSGTPWASTVRRESVVSDPDRKDTAPSLPMRLESGMPTIASDVGTRQTTPALHALAPTSSGSIELGRPIPSAPPIRPSPSPSLSSVGGVFSSAYPLPMSFHVVDNGPGKSTLQLLITAMGGGVIPTNPTSANYIILNLEPGHRATLPEHLAALHSVRGNPTRAVLSSAWINSCIKSGRVVPLEPYVVREAGQRLDNGSGSGSNALSLSLDLPPTPAPSGARSLTPDVLLIAPRESALPAQLVGTSTRSPALSGIRSLSPNMPLSDPRGSTPVQHVGTTTGSPALSGIPPLLPNVPLIDPRGSTPAQLVGTSTRSPTLSVIKPLSVPPAVLGVTSAPARSVTTSSRSLSPDIPLATLKAAKSVPSLPVVKVAKRRFRIESEDLEKLSIRKAPEQVMTNVRTEANATVSTPNRREQLFQDVGNEAKASRNKPTTSANESVEEAAHSSSKRSQSPSAEPSTLVIDTKTSRHYIEVDDSDLDELFSDNEKPSVGPTRRRTSPLSSLSPEPQVAQILGPDGEDATPPSQRSRSGSGDSATFSESRSGGTPSAVPGGRSASGKRRRNEIDLEDQGAYELLLDRLRKRSRGVSAKTFFSRLQSEKSKPYWRGLFRRYDRMIRNEVKGLEGWEP